MKLPSKTAAFHRRHSYGMYVARRLRTAQLTDVMNPVLSASLNVKSLGRKWEDAEQPVQEAMADRDAVADDLVTDAQEVRLELAGRGLQAADEPPYTLIFAENSSFYTKASLDVMVQRFHQLMDRMRENLPEDDALLAQYIPRLTNGIAAFEAAVNVVASARNAETRARDQLNNAQTSWADVMEKAFADLSSKLGKKKAERFFPRPKAGDKVKTAGESP